MALQFSHMECVPTVHSSISEMKGAGQSVMRGACGQVKSFLCIAPSLDNREMHAVHYNYSMQERSQDLGKGSSPELVYGRKAPVY